MLEKDIEKIAEINRYLLKNKKDFNKEIGKNIRNIRKNKKILLEDVSNMIDTSEAYVSQIEYGTNGMSLLKFVLICNSLKVMPNEIIGDLIMEEDESNIFYDIFQRNKNISENILEFMKQKYIR